MNVQGPLPQKKIKRLIKHGDLRSDPYYWLRNRQNPQVLRHLKEENKFVQKSLGHTRKLQKKIYREILSRTKESDLSVPVKKGSYYYYSKSKKGKSYPIYCRKRGSLKAREEVILDLNRLVKKNQYLDLGCLEISPDEQILAYSLDRDGSEFYTICFKDLSTGKKIDEVPKTFGSLEWAADSRTVFFTRVDHAHRPHRLYRHTLGQKGDVFLYEEENPLFSLWLSHSKDRAYIFLKSASTTSTEVRFLSSRTPRGIWKMIQRRRKKLEYSVEHYQGNFLILTNFKAKDFQVMKASVHSSGQKNWKKYLPHRKGFKIENIQVFQNSLCVFGRKNGIHQLEVYPNHGVRPKKVKFSDEVYEISLGSNPNSDSHSLRFHYESPVTPPTVFDLNLRTLQKKKLKQREVPGGFRSSRYLVKRIWAKGKGGVRIPMTLLHLKNLKKNGKHPTLLYGYGSYGATIDPYFSTSVFSLVDRGFVYAIAHVRGGSMLGRSWYEGGKLLRKKNTFYDFIACAETLVRQKYTHPKKLTAMGGSAGGLLMGAVMNLAPKLFQAIIADVPFVDVVTTILDSNLRFSVGEYEEWGNPNQKKFYRYMKSYSPYDNVRVQDYPHLLATAGLNDSRVNFWEPAKWVARLRESKTNETRTLFKVDLGAGHGGPSGRYAGIEEMALRYAFLLDCVGMKD